jgi:DeoR/GlpR family transcriptional regulator of sugar metabolism
MKTLRHEAIVNEVLRSGAVSVAALAQKLDVSEITIRRDLEDLDRAGRLQRVRSGAQRVIPRQPEPSALQRQAAQAEEKRAIARAAAELVQDEDVIALHLGTTTLELARVLASRRWHNLQVITNGCWILDALVHVPGVRVLLVGGIVSPDEMGTLGLLAEEMVRCLSVDKLFIGCRGIDMRTGTTHDLGVESAVATERGFAAAARQVILLADHSKFGQIFPLQSIPTRQIDVLVTDRGTAPEILAGFRQLDVRVISTLED